MPSIEHHLDHIIALVRDGFRAEAISVLSVNEQRIASARDAEIDKLRDVITLAYADLMLLEEACRYSLGLPEDMTGDALSNATGAGIIALKDQITTLQDALKLADNANLGVST